MCAINNNPEQLGLKCKHSSKLVKNDVEKVFGRRICWIFKSQMLKKGLQTKLF
jgi:hypothetical protein